MPSSGSADPKISLLFVDDEPALLKIGKAFLERSAGLRVDTQETAIDALRLLEKQSYDAIVSDYLMPDMDGIAFLRALRERGDSTPFIIFTGKGREEVVIEAFEAGADFYIQKGGDPKSQFAGLERKVRKAVDLHRAERATRESEEKYRTLIDRASQMLFLHDQHGALIDVNQKAIESTGYSREELLSMNVADIDPDVDKRNDKRWIWEGSPLLEERIFETRHRRKDGSIYPAEVHATRVTIAGEPCILALATDSTRRKEKDAAVQESEEMFRGIFENLQDIYYRTDADGKVTMLSPSAAGIFGYDSTDEVIGKPASDFWIYPEERKEILRRITEEGGVQDYEVTLKRADGHPLPVSVSCHQIYDRLGTATGNEGIIRDISERKQAEEKLRESEEKYRLIADNTADNIWIFDMDFRLRYISPSVLTMKGFTVEESLAQTVEEKLTPASYAALLDRFNEEMEREASGTADPDRTVSFETEEYCRDGRTILVENSTRLLRDEEGRPVEILGVSRDITKRKEMERALKSQLDLIEGLFESLPLGVIIIDTDGTILRMNRGVEEITGYSAEEIPTVEDCFLRAYPDPAYRDEVLTIWNNDKEGEVRSREWKVTCKDGRVRDIEFHAVFLTDGRIIVTISDVTERRRAEEEKERNEYRFSLLANQARAYTWEVDAEGLFTSISAESESITGYMPDEIVGKLHFFDLHPEEEREEFRRRVMEIFARQEPFREFEHSAIRKSGELFWVSTSGIPLIDDSGCLIGYWGTDTDITERKVAEDALRTANQKLQILSGITRHDIQNKIIILQAYLDLTRPEIDDPKLSNYLSEVDRAGSDIQRQIEFTRTYQELGVKRADWHTIEDLIASIADSGPPLFIDCIGYQILADQMVAKVFHNLMDNTIRHAEGVSRVEIRCEERDGRLAIIWEDDGPGIPDEQKERIFERGYGENSGLGLFLSREILAITRITIRETGEYGEGARFEMLVPAGAWQKSEANS